METKNKFSLVWEDFVSCLCCCAKNSKHSPPSRTSSTKGDHPRVKSLPPESDYTEIRTSTSKQDSAVRPSPSKQDPVVRPSPSKQDPVVRPLPSKPDPAVRPLPSEPDPAVRPSSSESLEAEPWYFPDTDRQNAEKMLLAEGNQTGAFLIRSSKNPSGSFSLSVLDQDRVKHYKILQLENGHYCMLTAKSFPTLKDMVEYYSKQADTICVCLCEPCKKVPPTLQPPAASDLEIERSSITLQKRLGAGQFGEVYEGLWNGSISVAVKILKPDMMEPVDFLQEAEFMKRLRHPKLIQLYAICTLQEPIFIITELMKHGSLLEYLQKDQGATLRVSDLIEMAAQVASGMEFLESQNYIHRDLAARNVLVGENNICKVADFGLARVLKRENENVYEAREGGKFPVKWTAPETITSNKFTVKSDVWSFGILLYEMMTFGQTPYPGMTNLQAVQWLIKGNRMPCPPNCPPAMHSIMMECWKKEEQDRPTFEMLEWKLEDLFDLPQ